MRVERYQSRQHRAFPACGCLAGLGFIILIGVIAVIVLIPSLPGLALRLTGAQPVGDTESAFDDTINPPAEMPPLDSVTIPPQITIQSGIRSQSFNGSTEAYTVQLGSTGTQSVAQATFDEAGLGTLCDQYSDFCGPGGDPVRNARIDLRPGGAVVYAEVNIPSVGWQQLGIVVHVVDTNRVEVMGLDVGGELYALPDNDLYNIVYEAEDRANAALNQLVMQAGGTSYQLHEIIITDTALTLVLR